MIFRNNADVTEEENAAGNAGEQESPEAIGALGNDAIDTISNLLRVYGSESFPIDSANDAESFPDLCEQLAGHVENGEPVPSVDIPRSAAGNRDWRRVRQLFAEHRRAEKDFVVSRFGRYRTVVEELLGSLKFIGAGNQQTAEVVQESLGAVEAAIEGGQIDAVRESLGRAASEVKSAFEEQERNYQAQLSELNERMSSLRQDLVAAREEMQRDALTEVYNRGAFDSALEQGLKLHYLLNQPVTVVLIDLDYFKNINDGYGHAAGDAALRAVGGCLERAFIRKGDIVARFGGDEFALILTDTTVANCAPLLDRFLAKVTRVELAEAPGQSLLSCSAGYTEIHETDTAETVLKRADAALYEAKMAGRNTARCVEFPADEA